MARRLIITHEAFNLHINYIRTQQENYTTVFYYRIKSYEKSKTIGLRAESHKIITPHENYTAQQIY